MFFMPCGGEDNDRFEGMYGLLWNGLPGFDQVMSRIGDTCVHGILIVAPVDLPTMQIGRYGSNASTGGSYDGQYVRVWDVWGSQGYPVDHKAEWLRVHYMSILDFFFGIVREHLRPNDVERTS